MDSKFLDWSHVPSSGSRPTEARGKLKHLPSTAKDWDWAGTQSQVSTKAPPPGEQVLQQGQGRPPVRLPEVPVLNVIFTRATQIKTRIRPPSHPPGWLQ